MKLCSPRTAIAVLVAIAVATFVSSPVAATTSPVNASNCVLNGGVATIPAGTEVEVRLSNFVKTRGLTTAFLRGQQTYLSIHGGVPIDVGSAWGDPTPATLDPFGEVWRTRLAYPTNVVLQAGQSMHFQLTLTAEHRYLDGLTFADSDSNRPAFFEPGTATFDCTVNAV